MTGSMYWLACHYWNAAAHARSWRCLLGHALGGHIAVSASRFCFFVSSINFSGSLYLRPAPPFCPDPLPLSVSFGAARSGPPCSLLAHAFWCPKSVFAGENSRGLESLPCYWLRQTSCWQETWFMGTAYLLTLLPCLPVLRIRIVVAASICCLVHLPSCLV